MTGNYEYLSNQLRLRRSAKGRVLYFGSDGALFACRGQRIFKTVDLGRSWTFQTRIVSQGVRKLLGMSRLGERLARHEVRTLVQVGSESIVAANREWIYYSGQGDAVMNRARIADGGRSVSPPLCISTDTRGRVLWGEYDSSRAHGKPVRVFISEDQGKSFEPVYTFEGGSIRHVHSLREDPSVGGYWVLVGDEFHEPGIGILSEDFKSLEWVGKGEQKYRAVDVFDLGDCLVYGTDSELEENAIVAMDKKSGKIEYLQKLEGSCIYSCKFGGVYAITTSVEPSIVNKATTAQLWLSRDAIHWTRCMNIGKDVYPPRLFQFGSIVLPRGNCENDTIFLSGQSLQVIDNTIIAGDWLN